MTTENRQFLKSLALTLVLAIAAFGIWRYEIYNIVGWSGTKWVYTDLFSPFVVALMTATAAVVPFYWSSKKGITFAIVAVLVLFVVGMASFFLAKEIMMTRFFPRVDLLVLIVLVNGLAFYLTILTFVKKVPIIYGIGVVIAIVGAYFFSVFAHLNFVGSIKLGYPFFFVVLNFGVLSSLTARFSKKKIRSRELDDVLDAPLFV